MFICYELFSKTVPFGTYVNISIIGGPILFLALPLYSNADAWVSVVWCGLSKTSDTQPVSVCVVMQTSRTVLVFCVYLKNPLVFLVPHDTSSQDVLCIACIFKGWCSFTSCL